jgi:hypothetical protein
MTEALKSSRAENPISWVKPRLLSTILYTCGEFDEDRAVATVLAFSKLAEYQAAIF